MSLSKPRTNDSLTVGGLFSGIGGIEYGLERAGMRVLWHCEQNDFCQRVLAHHHPNVPIYPDVTKLRGADVEPVDVLCGGFPCQDLSYAGEGAGLDGARSGLWSEYARLIGELRPRYVVVENVSALLARGLGRVLGDLAALGFDAEWDCLPASAFGAPHQRDRIWLVAYPGGEQHEGEGHAERRASPTGLPCSPAGVADADGAARNGTGCAAQAVPGPGALERPGRRGGLRGDVADPDEFRARKGYASPPGPANDRGRQTLSGAVNFKTPTAAPFSHGGSGGELHKQVAPSGGPLNPQWVAWLMGFPIDFTSLPRSATPSSRRSRSGSVGASSTTKAA